ncbi:hypothetical protein C8R45DRAFT_1219859 [Mycena sanguinolenta]|nr:hypothetical protein C8R45DRAFT_1219859 [Mycena sanguinolenta]
MFPKLHFMHPLWPMRVTAIIDLPNELWFEIFKHLSRDALRSVHGVSSLFHAISHALFFRDFVLDPDRHNLATSAEFIQRLNMYSSAPIANHVRRLSVSFQFGRWFRRGGRSSTSLNSPNYLLLPLLQAIPCFRNLRVLECSFRLNSEIHFASLGLQALPSLEELHIRGGKLYCPRDLTGSKIRVAHFFFTAIPEILLERRREGDTRRSFLSLLDPETLRSLTLSPTYDCSPAAWLAYDRDLFATFRNLSSVNIGCDGPFLRQVHAFLVQLPALQHLTLTGSHRRFTEFAPIPDGETLSSSLQSYIGPCEYIPTFLLGTSCTRLAINAYCTPDELRNALEDTSCTSVVTEISLRFSLAGACGWESPQELFALLPLLVALEIGISDFPLDDDDSDVFEAAETFDPAALSNLPGILDAVLRAPPGLRHAEIEWDLHSDTVRMLPDFEDLHHSLARAAPKIDVRFEGEIRPDCGESLTSSDGSFIGSAWDSEMSTDDSS